jgi:SAM-dependent methyltransferase
VALDLGCGRGEWLEILRDSGWSAIGVDADPDFGHQAAATGLVVHTGEVLDYLQQQPPGSVGILTAFHLVEHLPIEQVSKLLHEAKRVMADGAILIMETPNPENLTVASWSFHLDPTHVRPIPPLLLQFLSEEAGLDNCRIIRLSYEDTGQGAGRIAQIVRSMFTSAMDYALLAQVDGQTLEPNIDEFVQTNLQHSPPDITHLIALATETDAAMRKLHELVEKGERDASEALAAASKSEGLRSDMRAEIIGAIAELRAELLGRASLDERLSEQAVKAAWLKDERARLISEISRIQSEQLPMAMQLATLELQLGEMRRSTSWRITEPLRRLSEFFSKIRNFMPARRQGAAAAPLWRLATRRSREPEPILRPRPESVAAWQSVLKEKVRGR